MKKIKKKVDIFMPNETKNILDAEKITKLNIFRINENNQQVIDFNLIIPQPKTQNDCDAKYYVNKDSDITTCKGREWFDWYKWNCDNWGTKWNADTIGIDGDDTVGFFTAWRAPFPIISKISEMLGDIELKHTFYDISNYGSDIFDAIWRNGKMVKALVSVFDYDTEEYNEPIEVKLEN